MRKEDLHASTGPDFEFGAAIPVICDECRRTGDMGQGAFSELPDLLHFTPVQRRAHVNNWTAEHQRAFIAALAITGSPRQAARAIGKHAFGAEQLRAAKGGRQFAAAWDAALEVAQDREVGRVRSSLAHLAADKAASRDRALTEAPRFSATGKPIHPDCDYDPDRYLDDYPEYWEAKATVRSKLMKGRRMMLFRCAGDPAMRKAWELLVGPADWEAAARLDPQPGEEDDDGHTRIDLPQLQSPDMVLTTTNGFVREWGDHERGIDNFEGDMRFSRQLAEQNLTPEEYEAAIEERNRLFDQGFEYDKDGNLVKPD